MITWSWTTGAAPDPRQRPALGCAALPPVQLREERQALREPCVAGVDPLRLANRRRQPELGRRILPLLDGASRRVHVPRPCLPVRTIGRQRGQADHDGESDPDEVTDHDERRDPRTHTGVTTLARARRDDLKDSSNVPE